jgi:hypothetical protein
MDVTWALGRWRNPFDGSAEAMMSVATKVLLHVRDGDLIDAASKQRIYPRRLRSNPLPGGEGTSARRINRLFERMPGAERYLEIGLEYGYTFENVNAAVRWGVDPHPRFNIRRIPQGAHVAVTTSDEFFNLNPCNSFDVVFLDGLHTFRQAYRDLVNACRVCPNGAILIDDVVPCDEASAIPDKERSLQERRRRGLKGTPWYGDVFRVILCVATHHPELSFRTIVEGKSQALVWRNDPGTVVMSVNDALLEKIEARSFTDVFGHGIPEPFLPTSEPDAIGKWASERCTSREDRGPFVH